MSWRYQFYSKQNQGYEQVHYLGFNFQIPKNESTHNKASQISALKTVETPTKYLPMSVSPIKYRLNALQICLRSFLANQIHATSKFNWYVHLNNVNCLALRNKVSRFSSASGYPCYDAVTLFTCLSHEFLLSSATRPPTLSVEILLKVHNETCSLSGRKGARLPTLDVLYISI